MNSDEPASGILRGKFPRREGRNTSSNDTGSTDVLFTVSIIHTGSEFEDSLEKVQQIPYEGYAGVWTVIKTFLSRILVMEMYGNSSSEIKYRDNVWNP